MCKSYYEYMIVIDSVTANVRVSIPGRNKIRSQQLCIQAHKHSFEIVIYTLDNTCRRNIDIL